MQIQIEGCEASGKTTLLSNLKTYYQDAGYIITSTHYPTKSTIFGELAHKILDGKHYVDDPTYHITLLSLSDQKAYQSKFNNVKDNPRLINITSRGILSTLVYCDLYNPGITPFTTSINLLIEELEKPDSIVYLKPDIQLVESRLKARHHHSIYDKISLVKLIQDKYDCVIDWLSHKYDILTITPEEDTSPDTVLKLSTSYLNTKLWKD